ncbi:MAG: hypothetical protein ACI94Y_000151, partial [Maribacter sp.]
KNADIAVAMASIFNEVSQQKGKLECSVYWSQFFGLKPRTLVRIFIVFYIF